MKKKVYDVKVTLIGKEGVCPIPLGKVRAEVSKVELPEKASKSPKITLILK